MELKENTSIVVLGASGDLAKKKTVGAHRIAIPCFSLPCIELCANNLLPYHLVPRPFWTGEQLSF